MIHYHGTPCGGQRTEAVKFLAGRHALIPFSRPDDLGAALEVCSSICLDNGAFTVWKQGGELDVAGYSAWVASLKRHPAFDWALIPDVIDGSEDENDRLVAEWPHGTDGVPVWHLHETLLRLKALVLAFPRVALGSSGQWANPGTNDWWERMAQAIASIVDSDGRPMCKLHGLRMLNVDIFTRLPLASADSTNAVRNANLVRRFGIYPPPSLSQRMSTIANRIEAYQSAAIWMEAVEEPDLFAGEMK